MSYAVSSAAKKFGHTMGAACVLCEIQGPGAIADTACPCAPMRQKLTCCPDARERSHTLARTCTTLHATASSTARYAHDPYKLECLCLAAGCSATLQSSVRAYIEAEPQQIS